jgi:transcription elongation factor Elf1
VVTVSVTDSPARKYRCLTCEQVTWSWLEVSMGGRVQTPCCVRCGAEVMRATT